MVDRCGIWCPAGTPGMGSGLLTGCGQGRAMICFVFLEWHVKLASCGMINVTLAHAWTDSGLSSPTALFDYQALSSLTNHL